MGWVGFIEKQFLDFKHSIHLLEINYLSLVHNPQECWRLGMATDPTYNPRALVNDESGHSKFNLLTNWTLKTKIK